MRDDPSVHIQQPESVTNDTSNDPIDDPQNSAEERTRANTLVPSKLIFGIMLLLMVFLIAAALGMNPLSVFGGDGGSGGGGDATATPVFQSQFGGSGTGQISALGVGGAVPLADQACTEQQLAEGMEQFELDPAFAEYWHTYGGIRIFGCPISGPIEIDGRKAQWFERARLEFWPTYVGTEYAIQPARVGVEFTNDRDFPEQEFFANRDDLWFFPETGHGVGGGFLEFWQQNNGMMLLGYPISDEIKEILPHDQQIYTVQYFERGRLEFHPGATEQIMLGLLGRGLFLKESAPNIVTPLVKPTPVPVQP